MGDASMGRSQRGGRMNILKDKKIDILLSTDFKLLNQINGK
jgi:hypothetical protein